MRGYDFAVQACPFKFRIALKDMTTPGSFKATPTLSSGDFKVDIDGGGLNNLATLPTNTPAGSIDVLIALNAAEMNGQVITINGIDQEATKEWADIQYSLVTRQLPKLTTGTAQAGGAATITLAAGAPAYDLTGCIVRTTGGTGGGGTGGANNQASLIISYNTSTKVATINDNWDTQPDNTTTYDILLTDLAVNAVEANITNGGLTAAQVATGVWQDTTAGDFTVASSIGKALGGCLGTSVFSSAGGVTLANGVHGGAAARLTLGGGDATHPSLDVTSTAATGQAARFQINDGAGNDAYLYIGSLQTAASAALRWQTDRTTGEFAYGILSFSTPGRASGFYTTAFDATGTAFTEFALTDVGDGTYGSGYPSAVPYSWGAWTNGSAQDGSNIRRVIFGDGSHSHDITLAGDGKIWDSTNSRLVRFDLASTGLDAVLVESGLTPDASCVNDSGTQLTSINARQALAMTLATAGLGGFVSGATTTNPQVTGTGKGAGQLKTRASVTSDSSGDRSAVNLVFPT